MLVNSQVEAGLCVANLLGRSSLSYVVEVKIGAGRTLKCLKG